MFKSQKPKDKKNDKIEEQVFDVKHAQCKKAKLYQRKGQ